MGEYMIHGGRDMHVYDVCKWAYVSEYMMCDVLHCAVSVFVYVWRVSCVCVCVVYSMCVSMQDEDYMFVTCAVCI